LSAEQEDKLDKRFVDAFFHPYIERGMDSIEQHILEASPKPAVAPAP
jgi:hypothetical protein